MLTLAVCDHNSTDYSTDTVLGQVRIPIKAVDGAVVHPRRLRLHDYWNKELTNSEVEFTVQMTPLKNNRLHRLQARNNLMNRAGQLGLVYIYI